MISYPANDYDQITSLYYEIHVTYYDFEQWNDAYIIAKIDVPSTSESDVYDHLL